MDLTPPEEEEDIENVPQFSDAEDTWIIKSVLTMVM